jgi:predicted transcriptional regulator
VTRNEAIFTERELDVMNVLWDQGTGTVAEVRRTVLTTRWPTPPF